MKEQETKFNKQLGAQQKRLRELERNLVTKSRLLVSQAKEPKESKTVIVKKDDAALKARISTMEKASEHMKNKISTLESDLLTKELQLKKAGDDLTRLKSQKNKLLKEITDIKKREEDMLLGPRLFDEKEDLIPVREPSDEDFLRTERQPATMRSNFTSSKKNRKLDKDLPELMLASVKKSKREDPDTL